MIENIDKTKIIQTSLFLGTAYILIANPFKKKGQTQTQSINVVDAEIKDKQNKGEQPTYSPVQYTLLADALESAMSGIGTNEKAIYAIFDKLKKDIDLLKLYKAFGVRKYTGGYFWQNGDMLNLAGWLEQELTQKEKDNLNAILSRNKIKYRI